MRYQPIHKACLFHTPSACECDKSGVVAVSLTLLLRQLSHFARSIVEILHVMFAEMQECYATVFSRTIEPKKDKGREKRKTCQHLQIIRILPLGLYDHPFGERDSWILLIFR